MHTHPANVVFIISGRFYVSGKVEAKIENETYLFSTKIKLYFFENIIIGLNKCLNSSKNNNNKYMCFTFGYYIARDDKVERVKTNFINSF